MSEEYQVYLVDVNGDEYETDLDDIDFVDIAEEEGTVYSLEGFQKAFNSQEVDTDTQEIRILDCSLINDSTPSLKKFLDNYNYLKLAEAVIDQMGGRQDFRESASDIVNHGIDGGFGGFIYYSDTCDFYDKNKKLILKHLEDIADAMGQNTIEVVESFGCLRQIEKGEVQKFFIYCGESEYDSNIKNALAWYAAEEVCRAYIEELH